MPLEKGKRCFGLAGGMPGGLDGRLEVAGDEGSQRSGINDHGSG